MVRCTLVLAALGVSLILLCGCMGFLSAPAKNNTSAVIPAANNQSPAVPSANNTTANNTPAINQSPIQNTSPPAPQNQTSPPINQTPPIITNGSVSPPPSPPAVIITPNTTGSAVRDSTNGSFSTRSCSVSATPSIIKAGSESEIRFIGNAPNGEDITYTCGDEVRSNGNGGHFDSTRICLYPDAGPQTVWVALDGYVCASTPLEVDPVVEVFAKPSCLISANSQGEERNGTTTTYSAKLMFYNQEPSANLSWNCGKSNFTRSIGDAYGYADSTNSSGSPDSLLSGALYVTCRFDTWPPQGEPGSIFIDDVECGSMILPA